MLVLGREHYDRREYARSEPLLQQLIDADAGYADVHDMMGVMLHERGDFVGAATQFERAVALNPTYTEALLNLVIACNDIGQYERAREVLAKVAAIRAPSGDRVPDEFALGKIANMHADLAQAYVDAGCTADAVRELTRAVSMRPTFADLRLRLAALYRDTGRLADAKRELEAACESHPGYVQARVQLGIVLLALGEHADAAARFLDVLGTEPENRSAKMYLRIARRRASGAPPEPTSATIGNVAVEGPLTFDDDPTHVPR